MPDQIAFMVMPFGRKATGLTEKDAPADIDFDALWERVYQPILEERGYKAVRADRDAGALIISEMIQRLAIADLVVADITIANANVYYEVGVRHAAKEKGCVLVGAEWARPVSTWPRCVRCGSRSPTAMSPTRPRRRPATSCATASQAWSMGSLRCSLQFPASLFIERPRDFGTPAGGGRRTWS